MTLGERIATLRKRKKWSQNQLAELADSSKEAIGKYERGEVTPSVEVARRLAVLLDASLDYLVGTGENTQFNQMTITRMKEIEALPDKERETVFIVLDALLRDFKTRQAYGK